MHGFLAKLVTYSTVKGKMAAQKLRNRLTPERDLDSDLDAAGLGFAAFLERRRRAPRQYVERGGAHAERLKALAPDLASQTVRDAERILAHEFDLLGSGPFTPVDPERSARDGYRPIEWYLDPVRDLRFPRDVPHRDWNLYAMRPGNADVKYPWELARCQHWPVLGQAWRLTRDPRFAREIAAQLDDFDEANPVGIGINWTCTMDVALRAANWCAGLALVLDCDEIDEAFWHRAYRSLFAHARFIHMNLENVYEVTSNHFLSNVIGLHFLAAELDGLASARLWDNFARKALETEIGVQVHEDGPDFESSIPYHRLVAELFLGSARLAEMQGRPLSAAYHARLEKMIDFAAATLRPDGLMPVVGDADDGRLHILTRYGDWNRQDPRHLFAPAARLLGRPDWLDAAVPAEARWEAAWWGFDPGEVPAGSGRLPSAARLFPGAGIAVLRRERSYLLVTNGRVGTEGFGNHKHNELLGFEYHLDGQALIVDPGSYVYTSDPQARNLFRSTAYHNTLQIDGEEQNETNPEWLFRLIEKAHPEHVAFGEEDGMAAYRGRHRGYSREGETLWHERAFRLNPAGGELVVTDRLEGGAGRRSLAWHFHLAPDIAAEPDGPGRFRLSGVGVTARLDFPAELTASLSDAWYSPSYGVRLATRAIDLSGEYELEPLRSWEFRIGPGA